MQDEIKRLIKAADALAARFGCCGTPCVEEELYESFHKGRITVEVNIDPRSDGKAELCKECQRAETEYNTARAFVKD